MNFFSKGQQKNEMFVTKNRNDDIPTKTPIVFKALQTILQEMWWLIGSAPDY